MSERVICHVCGRRVEISTDGVRYIRHRRDRSTCPASGKAVRSRPTIATDIRARARKSARRRPDTHDRRRWPWISGWAACAAAGSRVVEAPRAAPRSLNVRRPPAETGHSSSSAPFSWEGSQGWVRVPRHRHGWHFFRHGRSLCGAHVWRAAWGDPKLHEQLPEHVRDGGCRRCTKRSSTSRMRWLSRDHGMHARSHSGG